MWSLPKHIMEHAEACPEATPLCPGALLHLGKRAAVDQALSRLARSGKLLRICQGVYMRPIETRFGIRAPGLVWARQSLHFPYYGVRRSCPVAVQQPTVLA